MHCALCWFRLGGFKFTRKAPHDLKSIHSTKMSRSMQRPSKHAGALLL